MIVIAGAVLGAATGVLAARLRGGRPLDMAHYAAVLGLLGLVLGMVVTVVLARLS